MPNAQFSFWSEPANRKRNLRRLRATVWLVTIGAGFLQAWASRFWITPDGNSYLDIASAYLRGDWNQAINAYWSPFFSWLLALCFGVFRPGPYWDSTIIHLLNFVGLLLSLCTFEFFFRAFLQLQNQRRAAPEAEDALPELGWWALGYALFLSTSLLVLSVINTTPDVWVAVWTYLVAGLLLRIRIVGGSPYLFAALGFALACAYLTKTFYFPMSFVFLATAWLATGNPRKTIKQAVLGLLVFTLVGGPWITAVSRAKHRFTFGDVGKLAFVIFYDQIPQSYFWQGEGGSGNPVHPVRQLMARPRLFEFAAPVGGTYPPAFDPSYWMEGARPHFHLRAMLRVLRQSMGTFFQIWTIQSEFAVIFLVLIFLLPATSDWRLSLRRQFYIWIPPLIACFNYFIVLVEFRYVAPFVLLLWIAGFAFLLGGTPSLPKHFLLAMAFAVFLVTSIRITKSAVSDLAAVLGRQANVNWQVAEGLRSLGSQPGDRVAGLSRVAEAHWARLAGVKIVAEIPLGDENYFWAAAPEEKQKVFQVFAGTGARFVVTRDAPASAAADGWIPLGNTGFYAYRLPSALQTGPAP